MHYTFTDELELQLKVYSGSHIKLHILDFSTCTCADILFIGVLVATVHWWGCVRTGVLM